MIHDFSKRATIKKAQVAEYYLFFSSILPVSTFLPLVEIVVIVIIAIKEISILIIIIHF